MPWSAKHTTCLCTRRVTPCLLTLRLLYSVAKNVAIAPGLHFSLSLVTTILLRRAGGMLNCFAAPMAGLHRRMLSQSDVIRRQRKPLFNVQRFRGPDRPTLPATTGTVATAHPIPPSWRHHLGETSMEPRRVCGIRFLVRSLPIPPSPPWLAGKNLGRSSLPWLCPFFFVPLLISRGRRQHVPSPRTPRSRILPSVIGGPDGCFGFAATC